MDRLTELRHYEYEARRLRAEYAGDLMVRAAITLDFAIRRVAYRMMSWPAWAAGAGVARSERDGYRCFESRHWRSPWG